MPEINHDSDEDTSDAPSESVSVEEGNHILATCLLPPDDRSRLEDLPSATLSDSFPSMHSCSHGGLQLEAFPSTTQSHDRSQLEAFPSTTQSHNRSPLEAFPSVTQSQTRSHLEAFPSATQSHDRSPLEAFPSTTQSQTRSHLEAFSSVTQSQTRSHLEAFPSATIRASSTISQCLAEAFKANFKAESPIPEYLKDFTSVFSKTSFDILPEPKEWDHAVKIIPGSKASNCKVYPLSPAKQKELDAFLKENLETGCI
jgi:hypothetical protein